MTKLGIVASFVTAVALIAAIVIAVLVYTPAGTLIRIPNPHLEQRYVAELMHVQDRLNRVTEDVVFMREFNLQLRRALGEDVSPEDTLGSITLADRQPIRRGEVRDDIRGRPDDDGEEIYDSMLEYGILGLTTGPVRIAPTSEARFRPTLPITLPVDGYVTRTFDAGSGHVGIDIAGKMNTPIAAVADGTVIFSGWTYHDGNMVIISHGGGYFSVYKHNQSNIVQQGAVVRRGETIALLGNTGKHSYGPHLHFELWKDGVPLDPAYYLFEPKDIL